jgi:predicted permease
MRLVHDAIGLWQRLRTLFSRSRKAHEIDEEIAFHLAMRQADEERAGAPRPAAARAARRAFGNVSGLKEQTRDMWTFPSLDSVHQDAKYALRTLRQAPGFSFVAILILATGIGANTAIFSLIDATLVRGLPYPEADRLVLLIGNVQRAVVERRGNSYPDHVDWRSQSTSFEDMAAYTSMAVLIGGGDEPERLPAEAVSAPYFSILGVAPAHGRTFRTDEDAVPNRDLVVVLSHALWQRRYGGDPAILNRTIQIGPRTFTVIGIMPSGFAGVSDQAQVWLPFMLSGYDPQNRGTRGFQTVARLKPGISIDAARAELALISRQLEQAYPASNEKRGVEVSPLAVETFGPLRPVVVSLMASVALVMLIVLANVANLMVGRSEARQREIAIRSALGAGQARLLRQLVTESVVLTLIAAAAGLALAETAARALIAASPVTFPSFVAPRLNVAVLGFTVGVSIVTALLLGVAPALHASASRLLESLRESARGSTGTRAQRFRSILVVAEVALAIVLLVGAGLMIRSVQKLAAIDPGFDPSSLLTLSASIPRQAAPAAVPGAPAPPPPFVVSSRDLLDRVRAVPGVASVSLASDLPLTDSSSAVFYSAEGDATAGAQTMPRAYVHRVTPEFFATMRMPIKTGRTFDAAEMSPAGTAVIVSEQVARRFWPDQDPVGRRIKVGTRDSANPWLTIVGVVGEVNYRGLPRNPTADPDLYFPVVDRSPQGILIRTSTDPASVIEPVRTAIRELHPAVVVFGATTMEALVAQQTAASRFTTWMLSLFAVTALVLSLIGVYGVMSYLVARRTREFGIRFALGATRREIIGVVLRQAGRLIAIGVVIGAAASVVTSRLLTDLLYQVTATDFASLLAVLALVTVAVIACIVPAIRATRVNPVVALRAD